MPNYLISLLVRQPSTLIFLKKFNDNYGHDGSDVVLEEIGKLLFSHAGSGDICCRFGEEEIIIAMPDTESENAIQIAERICR